MAAEKPARTKPRLRGHLHQAAFFVALGACAMLLHKCRSDRALGAAAVYSLSLIELFGVSALYHRPQWEARARQWLRRADHASIFILIGGTVTPICRLALPGEAGDRLLLLTWAAAGLGVLQSLFWVKAPKWISAVLAVAVGCIAIPFLPALRGALPAGDVALIALGGAMYVLGAGVYAVKRPDPWPAFFGYHEVFHLLVILAAAAQFVVIDRLVAL